MFLAWLAALALGPQQKGTEDVLRLMERRAEGLRDVRLRIRSVADPSMGGEGISAEAEVTYVRGAGLRVRSSSRYAAASPASMPLPARGEFIYAPEALYIRQEWSAEHFEGAGAMAGQGRLMGITFPILSYRVRYDDPALKSQDIYLLPRGIPVRMAFEEPLVYCMLDPRFFLGLEPNLTYGGERTEGGRTYHVLVSSPDAEPADLSPQTFAFRRERREFFVDAETGALGRLCTQFVIDLGMMDEDFTQRMSFVAEARGEVKAGGEFSLPATVTWKVTQEGMRESMDQGRMVRTIHPVGANAGLAPSAILGEEEKGDLYADAILRRPETYEARVKRDPRDAESLYSLAHARAGASPLEQILGPGGPRPLDTKPITEAFEAALEIRPGSEGAASNLLFLYARPGGGGKEKTLLERIEKGKAGGPRARLLAAERLGTLGEYDRAERLLESSEPSGEGDRRRIAMERLFVAAARADEAAVARIFVGEAARRTTTAEKIDLVRSIEGRAAKLPEAARKAFTAGNVAALVEEGMKARPGDVAYRIARAAVRRWEGRPAAAAAELLEAAPGDGEVVDYALDELDPAPKPEQVVQRMGPGGADKPQAPEWSAEDAARLAEALARVSVRDPRVVYQAGRALRAAGRPEEARARFAAALEACAAQGPGRTFHSAALRTAFRLGAEEDSEEWRRKCVDVILVIGKDGGMAPTEYLLDDRNNPVTRVAREHVNRKEWLKFYRLAVEGKNFMRMSSQIQEDLTNGGRSNECFEAIRKEVYAGEDVKKYLDFADFLESYGGDAEVPGALEKAREKAPDDAGILERLAEAWVNRDQQAKAAEAYEDLLRKIEGPRQAEVRLKLARSRRLAGDTMKARAALGEIDLKALVNGATAEQLAEACAEVEDWDRGLAACRRAYELGRKPHFRMGQIFEKKGDFMQAILYYNRDIAEPQTRKSLAQQMEEEMRRQVGETEDPDEKREPRNGKEARERLLGRLGPDYLLNHFLKRTFDPLPPGEEAGVKAAARRLSSDSIVDREEAYETLRKAGPNAAPLLRHLLDSTDEEVRGRARRLFTEWAEPR